MSKETRQYTLFAQKNVQTDFTIITSQGEVLELDYPCWVYYVNYIEEMNNNRYLVVKDSNGSLLEVRTKNDVIPDNLAEWRAIKWIDIPFTEYVLDISFCQWTNIATDSVIIINSNEELENYITCMRGNYPTVDFSQYSLLLVHGNTNYGSIANLTPSMALLAPNNYKLNIEIQLQDTAASQEWHTAILVPKMEQNVVYLNMYYPHISVWKYITPYPLVYYRDGENIGDYVTIILTMDSLLGKFYTNAFPQDLILRIYYRTGFLFADGIEGEYLIEKDTVHFYYSDGYSQKFTRTMFSSNSMLLHSDAYSIIPEEFIVPDYLFIKQNYNY
jgi:hypothetical protein